MKNNKSMKPKINLDNNSSFRYLKSDHPELLLSSEHGNTLLTHAFKKDGVMKVCAWRYNDENLGRTIFTMDDDVDIEEQLKRYNIIIPKFISTQMQIDTAVEQFNNNSGLYRGAVFNDLWFNRNDRNGYDDCVTALKNIQQYDGHGIYSDFFFAKNDQLMLSNTLRQFLNFFNIMEKSVNTRHFYNDIVNIATTDGVLLMESILPYYIEAIDYDNPLSCAMPNPSFLRLDFVV